MQQDGPALWTPGSEIPGSIDPYRFWLTQQVDGSFQEQTFILPYLINGDSPGQLRERFGQLEKKLETELYLPEFYRKLYFANGKNGRPRGPFQIVVLARLSGDADLLASEIPGVIAASHPIPEPVWPETSDRKRPASARLDQFLTKGRRIRRLVGVIDTDIAFANARFRLPGGGTRFGWFWDMDANAYPGFGRMMARSQIDGYLATLSPTGGGELRLYQSYIRDSYLNPWDPMPPPAFGHGTGVLDAAMGGEVLGADDDTMLIGVQLPRYAVGLTHGQFLWLFVLMAIDMMAALSWMIEDQQGRRPETLVNISVGGHGGRHDGQSGLELAMDQRIQNGDLQAIYLAAGNSYGTRVHASFTGQDLAHRQDLLWRLPPDDGTYSFLEIWLPDDAPDQLSLTVQLPRQPAQTLGPGQLNPGQTHDLFIDGVQAGMISVQSDPPPLGAPPGVHKRTRILLSVRPTALSRPRFVSGPDGMPQLAGDWLIGLQAGPNLKKKQIVTLWISRDDEILRLPTGARQSFFTDYSPATAQVVNDGTISDMASGKKTTICAAHGAADRMMTRYSGRGIPKHAAVAKRDIFPTASYVADESESHPGVLVSGYFSGSALWMSGTSIASPQVLRLALTGALPGPAGQSIRKRVGNLAAAQEASDPVHDNPVKAKAQQRETSGPEDYGKGRLRFVQHGLGQPGSTNYPRRRRDSI